MQMPIWIRSIRTKLFQKVLMAEKGRGTGAGTGGDAPDRIHDFPSSRPNAQNDLLVEIAALSTSAPAFEIVGDERDVADEGRLLEFAVAGEDDDGVAAAVGENAHIVVVIVADAVDIGIEDFLRAVCGDGEAAAQDFDCEAPVAAGRRGQKELSHEQ